MIGIVTATYNRAHTLARAAMSLLAQRNPNWKWAVYDDGSRHSPFVVLPADDRIKFARGAVNLGIGAAKRKAIGMLDAEWLFILDDDDWLLPDALDVMYGEIDDTSAAITFQAQHITEAGRLGTLVNKAKLVRRTAYNKAGEFDPAFTRAHDDTDLFIRLKEQGPIKTVSKRVLFATARKANEELQTAARGARNKISEKYGRR